MSGFDVVGDIHGQLGALKALGRELGYDVEQPLWPHPTGRKLVFLGDLVDRGAHSLEVAQLVKRLCEAGRAACIMGNHEFNLVAHQLKVAGYEKPKDSNARTIGEIARRPAEWDPVLDFFATLPLGIELDDLRIIHACWHEPSIEKVAGALAPTAGAHPTRFLDHAVALASPFEGGKLKAGLVPDDADEDDPPHEVLMKGYEEDAPAPFKDEGGTERKNVRVTWWKVPDAPVAKDRTLVIGHYWNLPPIDGVFCPPHSSGTKAATKWSEATAPRVEAKGRVSCRDAKVVCVDFNGVTSATDRACIGALRWPEREVVWASGEKTGEA